MIQCKNRLCAYQTKHPWICFRSFENKERPPNKQLPHFLWKASQTGARTCSLCPQEEPLCPCSATRHPARGALPPRRPLPPSTCLPSWPPTLTSGPPACVKPMGHTIASNSSLRPPVSGGLRALYWGHISLEQTASVT